MTEPLDHRITAALHAEAGRLHVDVPRARAILERRIGRRSRSRALLAAAVAVAVLAAGLRVWSGAQPTHHERLAAVAPTTVTTQSLSSAGQTPLIVATGWGVVYIDGQGDQHVVEDLSGGTGDWFYPVTVRVDDHEVVQRVARAYSDLMGGVVYGTDNAIVWLPADGGRKVLAWVAPEREDRVDSDPVESITLQDVAVIDDHPNVVYTKTTTINGPDIHGSGSLETADLGTGATATIEVHTWTDIQADWWYYGQVSYAHGTFSVVRGTGDSACRWVDLLDEHGRVMQGAGPRPRPPDPSHCPYETTTGDPVPPGIPVEGATLSEDGSALVELRGVPTLHAPQMDASLDVYNVDDGKHLRAVTIETPDDEGLGFVGVDVLGSAATLIPAAGCPQVAPGPIEPPCGPFAAPTMTRDELVRTTEDLSPDDPRWIEHPPEPFELR